MKVKNVQDGTDPIIGAPVDKLDAIRAILMGEQMQSTDAHIATLQKNVHHLETALGKAEDKFSARLIALESAFGTKQKELQELFEQKIKQVEAETTKKMQNERKELGNHLVELGKKIMA